MDQPQSLQSASEKLQLGIERLARAQEEPDLLGSAMLSIHGALEDQFRHILTSTPRFSSAEQQRIQDVGQVKWKELCDLMQKYKDLSDRDVRYIMRMNTLRIKAGHGGVFPGSYKDVAEYVEFVKGWVRTTESTNSRSFVNRCPCCQGMDIKTLQVIHHEGISVVERRRGKTEIKRTGLSLQTSPPTKKKFEGAAGWCLAMIFFGFPLIGGIVSASVGALDSIPLIGNLLAAIVSLFFLGVMLLGLIYPFYRVRKFNKTEYPRLIEEWKRTFMCKQCGHKFRLDSSLT